MLGDDHPADRQAESASGPVRPTGIRGVLFENRVDVLRRDGWAGIANVDPVRIRPAATPLPPLGRRIRAMTPALPEIRIAVDLNVAAFRSELAGVVQNVDQDLFDLSRLEQQ